MENKFKVLNAETEYKDTALSFFSSTFKVNDFTAIASEVFRDRCLNILNEALKSQGRGEIPVGKYQSRWFGDGIDCEILSPGTKGWQQGKVRIKISLEFCPDEPEIPETPESDESGISQPRSPLDDIRQISTIDGQ